MRRAIILALSLLVVTVGCRSIGNYVWVDAYKDHQAPARPAYAISRGDVIAVRVWNQESMSGRARVRSDGMISLPFVNDVEAAGFEPATLARRIEAKLREFVKSPVVTISVEEQAPLEISVVGEVTRPGVYRVDPEATVLKALASAGGLTPLAGRDRIFVLRPADTTSQPIRIRFTYDSLAHAEAAAARFRLWPGDVVVVE